MTAVKANLPVICYTLRSTSRLAHLHAVAVTVLATQYFGNHTERFNACEHWYFSYATFYEFYFVLYLTLSSPVVSNGYTSKCSGPYWSNPPFLIFLTFGHSARMSKI